MIPALWSMIAGACLATGAFHLGVGLRPPRQRARLLFAALAASVTLVAVFALLVGSEPAQSAPSLRRWMQVPVFIAAVLVIVFVRSYFHAGRPWLAGATCGVALAALLFEWIGGAETVEGGGWSRAGEVTPFLLLAYAADAAATAWRGADAPDERRRVVVGGVAMVAALAIIAVNNAVFGADFSHSAYAYAFAAAIALAGVGSELGSRWSVAQDRFRLVLEAASNGLLMVDRSGQVTLANGHAEEIFGYTGEELAGMRIDELLQDVHFGGHRGAALLALAGREVLGVRKDRRRVPVLVGVTAIESSDGVATLLAVTDLTERKRAEDLLRHERAFLRQVIDTDPSLIFSKDRQGRFTLANKSVADLYGTTVEGLIGKSDADFNGNPAEIEAFRRDDLRVMDTLSEIFIAEERVTDSKGKVHIMQTVKRPIVGEDGRAHQVLGVATDISSRKEAELQLGVQRNELAHLSRAMLVAELSGSLAHELNQPLAAILSNAQAALRFIDSGKTTPEELAEILRDIVNDDKRAGQVIQGLRLLLTKGETKHDRVEVNEVVQDVLTIMHSDLINAGVGATVRYARGLPIVLADRVQVQQVLLNLIVNGCDAMSGIPAQDRHLVIATALQAGMVRVCVTDRGPGIAPEHAPKIFEPFFTTKRHGLGIGLSICRNIVTMHGGRLWAEDDPGGGTTFMFTLAVPREEA